MRKLLLSTYLEEYGIVIILGLFFGLLIINYVFTYKLYEGLTSTTAPVITTTPTTTPVITTKPTTTPVITTKPTTTPVITTKPSISSPTTTTPTTTKPTISSPSISSPSISSPSISTPTSASTYISNATGTYSNGILNIIGSLNNTNISSIQITDLSNNILGNIPYNSGNTFSGSITITLNTNSVYLIPLDQNGQLIEQSSYLLNISNSNPTPIPTITPTKVPVSTPITSVTTNPSNTPLPKTILKTKQKNRYITPVSSQIKYDAARDKEMQYQ